MQESSLFYMSSPACVICSICKGFPGGANGKAPTCQCRRLKKCGFDPWVGKIPWRRKQQPTSLFLPGESHRQRSLGGYSPCGRKEMGMTEELLMMPIQTTVRCNLIVLLIYISLIISNIEHLFIFLLAFCISSLEKCLFRSFVHFLIGLFGFVAESYEWEPSSREGWGSS